MTSKIFFIEHPTTIQLESSIKNNSESTVISRIVWTVSWWISFIITMHFRSYCYFSFNLYVLQKEWSIEWWYKDCVCFYFFYVVNFWLIVVEIFLDSYFYFPFSLYPDIKYDREIVQVYIVQHMYNFKAECDKLHILSFNGGNNWTAKKILRKNYFFKT